MPSPGQLSSGLLGSNGRKYRSNICGTPMCGLTAENISSFVVVVGSRIGGVAYGEFYGDDQA